MKNSNVKTKILEDAYELILEKGIKETSLKDIASKVGISKGTLYYYYQAKEDLIFDIADCHIDYITKELLELFEQADYLLPKQEIISNVIKRVLSANTRGKMNLYLVSQSLTNSSTLRERFVSKYTEWQVTIKNTLDKVYGPHEDNYAMSQLLLSTIDGLIIQRLLGVEDLPIDDIARLIANTRK